MRFLDEFRDGQLAQKLVESLRRKVEGKRQFRFMEVCGTHTVAVFRSGLRSVLPAEISLLSGPGCPVCVTAQKDIDLAIEVACCKDTILATFGDMFKVPGTRSSLRLERAKGADIRLVYSPSDALAIAEGNPEKKVVFFGVGFETTTPPIALAVAEASRRELNNFSLLTANKVMPPPMRALLTSGEVAIDGFLLPGHVSTIIGAKPYHFIAADFHVPCVISGFEPLDILQSIHMLVDQILTSRAEVEIQYRRVVRPEGNPVALETMNEVFQPSDAVWRGLGEIPLSGLVLREKYGRFAAERVFDLDVSYSREPVGCSCGEVLRGVLTPNECKLFAKACSPDRPFGPCMVSSEGTCYAYYHYGRE